MHPDLRLVRCVIFDFAGTLSFEPYFSQLGPEFCSVVTEAIFTGENKKKWATPWTMGMLSSMDIAHYLSSLTDIASDRIHQALYDGCSHLELNPSIWQFARSLRALGKKSALATLNMDVFTDVVVPSHGFDQVFDVVVNSSDFGVDTKLELCEIALSRLEGCTFQNSLLIDDSPKSTEPFIARGGAAYLYTTDEAFTSDFQGLI